MSIWTTLHKSVKQIIVQMFLLFNILSILKMYLNITLLIHEYSNIFISSLLG